MNDIIQQIRSAYGENPESALKLLPELFRATDEEKIIELPCKVNDILWYIGNGKVEKCQCIGYRKCGKHCVGEIMVEGLCFADCGIYICNFRKTVFLTRKVAEVALKERKK